MIQVLDRIFNIFSIITLFLNYPIALFSKQYILRKKVLIDISISKQKKYIFELGVDFELLISNNKKKVKIL